MNTQVIPKQAHVCPGSCEKEVREGRCCKSGHCDYADPVSENENEKVKSKK